MLNPLHLRTLSVVLRTGSFAAAGRHLGYTGSAVSQQMSALEADSGLLLFEREAHGVRPTAEAQLLSERAIETLGAFATLQDAVREMAAGTRGRLGLGSFPTASEVLIPRALARFGRDFRDVEVRFEDGEPHQLVPGCSRATSTSSSCSATTWSRRAGRPAACVRRCSPSPYGCWCPTAAKPSGRTGAPDGLRGRLVDLHPRGNRRHLGPRASLRRRRLHPAHPLPQQRLRRRTQLRPGRLRSRGGAPPGLPRPPRPARRRRHRAAPAPTRRGPDEARPPQPSHGRHGRALRARRRRRSPIPEKISLPSARGSKPNISPTSSSRLTVRWCSSDAA